LALALLTATAGTARASVDPGAIGAEPAAAAAHWWAAFEDPALDGLVAAAGGTAAAQGAVVRAYIELRVAQARLQMSQRLLQAAAQQRVALEQLPPQTQERGGWLAAVALREKQWSVSQRQLQAERERAEATLAALSRSELPKLRQTLDVPEGKTNLPQVRQDLPQQPAAVETAGGPLQDLHAAVAQAMQARQLVEASELELRARQLRQQAGADSEVGVIEAYQQLVADNDRLAALAGRVAVAWALLLQGSGSGAAAPRFMQTSDRYRP
jgi:hypothetical protein